MLCREGDAGSQLQAWNFLNLNVRLHCIRVKCGDYQEKKERAEVGHSCQLQSFPDSKDAMVGKPSPFPTTICQTKIPVPKLLGQRISDSLLTIFLLTVV